MARAATRAVSRATSIRGPAPAHAEASVRLARPRSRWPGVATEACWLAAAILVPLIVLPERSFLSFTSVPKIFILRLLAGCVACLLVVRLAQFAGSRPHDSRVRWPSLAQAHRWILASPSRLVVAGVGGVLAAVAVSTAFSLSPYLSVWGKDPGSDGYGLYNMACYVVLAIAAATQIRSEAQIWRLLGAISATGVAASVIAIVQNFGFSPLDVSATAGVRVTGTSGNPIFLGALLALTVPTTLAVSARLGQSFGFDWRWWSMTVAMTAVQVAALALTLSRGPWLGVVAAVVVFVGIMWGSGNRRMAVRVGGVLGVSALLPVVTLMTPTLFGGGPTPTMSSTQQRLQEAVPAASVIARVATVDDEAVGGLGGRWIRWTTSLELAIERPPVAEGADPGRFIRMLAGYGPDMFRFAFPLRAPTELASVRTDAAHNDPINTLVEIGMIGLVAHIALGAAVVAAVMVMLRGARRAASLPAAGVAAALGAVLVGRVVEQSSGIAKPGDLTVTWLLLGLAAAAPVALGVVVAPDLKGAQPVAARVQRQQRHRPAWASGPALAAASSLTIALLLFVTWAKAVNYLRADHLAAGTNTVFTGDPARGLEGIEAAITLAPDVRDYHHRRSLMFQALADADPVNRQALLRSAADADAAAVELNPMSIDSNLAAAYSAWRVAQGGDAAMALQALETYERLAQLTPSSQLVQERLESLRSVVRVAPVGASGR